MVCMSQSTLTVTREGFETLPGTLQWLVHRHLPILFVHILLQRWPALFQTLISICQPPSPQRHFILKHYFIISKSIITSYYFILCQEVTGCQQME